jgi:hypothetical protein
VDHCLLVPRLVVAKRWVLVQRLPNAGDIAMPKDPKTAGEKLLLQPITFYILILQKTDERLRHGQAHGSGSSHRSSLMRVA